jgi:hypothetical protein
LLTADQVAALRQAANFGDYYQLLELLAEIAGPGEDPLKETVQCMREMVEKYDYEGLENLLESGGSHDE